MPKNYTELSDCNQTSLPALAQKLGTIDLEELAIETGLIVRKTQKFSATSFTISLLQSLCTGKGSLTNIASQMGDINSTSLSKQGLNYRTQKSKSVTFLKALSQALSERQSAAVAKGQHFNRVLLQDSTQARMPTKNSEHYKGISNQWGAKSSAKIDTARDALSGELCLISLDHGTHQDRVFAHDLIPLVEANDLILRDMGYFSTEGLQSIADKGAYYISRIPNNTSVTLKDEKAIEAVLKATPLTESIVDVSATLTQASRTQMRVVAIRNSEEVAGQRKRKAKAHRKKMGNQASKYTIEREGWTLYVTNLSKESFNAQKVHEMYSCRWGVEIQFRALKGQTHIRKLLDRRVGHKSAISTLLYTIMIFAQLAAKTHAFFKRTLNPEYGVRVSMEQVAAWLAQRIPKVVSLDQVLYYDIRHLLHGKKRRLIPQSIKVRSLF